MNSLVADYGTSSSESDEERPNDEDIVSENKIEIQSIKLPTPDFDGSSSKKSVFSNPFVEAENAKKAILEKHVKMVPTKGKVEMINGKKICWNYRKGRCHFGHNCTFAHDTDLQRSSEDLDPELIQCESAGGVTRIPPPGANQIQEDFGTENFLQNDKWENQVPSKKKRPGLTSGLIPSKKAKKIFKKTNPTSLH